MCISAQEVYDNYEHWVNNASVNYFRNEIDGEMIRALAPKRGNRAYARLQKKKIDDVISGLDKLNFEVSLPGRNGVHLGMMMFLVTLTYDHKRITAYDAWGGMSKDIASAKVQIKRALGASHINVMTVKEGTQGDYPAPHLLVIVDRPVHCIRYKGKRGIKYILQSRTQLDVVKHAWKHGFLDIQGVKDQKVGKRSAVAYLGKYLVKAVDLEKDDVAFHTMAWQKHFNLRSMHISRQFKDLLNPVRLDTNMHESQQGSWVFDHVQYIDLSDFDSIMLRKDEEIGDNDALIGILERLRERRSMFPKET